MTSPRTLKEVQSLTELKEYLGKPHLLSKPEHGEDLLLYLSVSSTTVSSVLIREVGKVQHPVYYVSRALQDAERRYLEIEKLALALVSSARKLRPYFQSHTIVVLTNHPLRQVLQKPETSCRLIKWSIELGEFDIIYRSLEAVKAQAVVDFLSEFTNVQPPSLPTDQLEMSMEKKIQPNFSFWILHVDGASNQQGSEDNETQYALLFGFKASNNEAEYEALLTGLRLASELGVQQLRIFSDSQLVVNHVTKEHQDRDKSMSAYLAEAKKLLDDFIGRSIPVEFLEKPSIEEDRKGMFPISSEPTWMDPIRDYLTHGFLPEDKAEARRVRYRSSQYLIINNKLYKRGFSLPYLRCLTPDEANSVLREIHEGVYGNHSGTRSLAHKALRQGYYWPTLQADAKKITQTCPKCQEYTVVPHQPPENLTSISSPWSFAQWGIDLIGPMPRGKVTDNGKQFDNAKLRELCAELNIKHFFASPAHPQANGQVEAINKTSHRTSTGDTHYALAFGAEAVVPVEIGIATHRVEVFQAEANDDQMNLNLDLVDERRDHAQLHNASYQQRVARYYNSCVKHRAFQVGDLVLRKVMLATRKPLDGSLGPT
ncbi:PREDICTED: uncharacterized protein LOC107880143 [Prunus mume]|uniref:Uncharacterized protein LOC107880143 n=1 Tax=Prunus mume TaxID=102107 RepID=A0ABM1LZ36_PRUMU|nr:PREDICTED: uncharacterized protein LOC107880143 [Prunus mume]